MKVRINSNEDGRNFHTLSGNPQIKRTPRLVTQSHPQLIAADITPNEAKNTAALAETEALSLQSAL
ncbi:hypothetical protein [Aeromonas cavernicola]|uniref:Uncharacterized protein n=1 Tax=Aeromonas cavernicola TaxID=1006623 RepID=A0A2H9U3P5_9GAMM|nr:hypothetical protein [Aeromonas cavernicola]PJG58666.1 hypothetical protein CUC53_11535 [Aeromonas cavernicola]